HGTDREPAQDADRQVSLRVLRFFRSRGYRIEPDVGEENDRGTLVDAAETVRCERMVVGGVDMAEPHHDEERQDDQLYRDQDVVDGGAFSYTEEQQPRDQHDDGKGRDIDQDRDTPDVRGRIDQTMDRRITGEQRGAVAGREPGGEI